jgi:tetratricopeptide (TPR) repeat protein
VSGRRLFWPLGALLFLAFIGQSLRFRDRLGASVTLHQVEMASLQAARMGRAGAGVLRGALPVLRRAAERDPLEVGIPIAIGSVHLLLDSPPAAIAAYREALALEPRPEIYLNLGRAQARAGDLEAARESFATALRLDPRYESQVPEPLRPPAEER